MSTGRPSRPPQDPIPETIPRDVPLPLSRAALPLNAVFCRGRWCVAFNATATVTAATAVTAARNLPFAAPSHSLPPLREPPSLLFFMFPSIFARPFLVIHPTPICIPSILHLSLSNPVIHFHHPFLSFYLTINLSPTSIFFLKSYPLSSLILSKPYSPCLKKTKS